MAASPLVGTMILGVTGPGLLEEQRAGARREGLPLTPDDLRPNPPVPDSQNAGPLLKELTQRYNALPKRECNLWDKAASDFLKNPKDATAQAEFSAGLTRYTELIALVEDAVERPHCDLAYDWNLGPNLLFPEFTVLRQFARTLVCRALLAQDASSAWADITRAAKLGNLIGETPCIIAALVSVAIHANADKGYIETLKRFGPSPEAHAAHAAFGPPLDPEHYFKGEVVLITACMKLLREGKLAKQEEASIDTNDENSYGFAGSSVTKTFSLVSPIAAAFWEKQLLVFWRKAFQIIREAKRTDDYSKMQEMDRFLKAWERDRINLPQNVMALILAPVFSQAPRKTQLAILAQKSLRESALALLEERAKTGAFPDSPTLPIDPFSPTKQTLRYKKEGTGCTLYSVGDDGNDDGGMAKRTKNSDGLDLVVRL